MTNTDTYLTGNDWDGPPESIAFDEAGRRARLNNLGQPCYAIRSGPDEPIGLTNEGRIVSAGQGQARLVAAAWPSPPQRLGDPTFRADHGVEYAYMAGSMANGISSEEMVIALGRAGLLGSFGAAGLVPDRVEAAIHRIQQALPHGPYAFNLIHSPAEMALERAVVALYLQYDIRTVEASAFLNLTPSIVRYRAAGLSRQTDGQIEIKNRVIAKLSRREVAAKFLQAAPDRILSQLVEQNLISREQAELAAQVPMADDITVEADSGGHTDNRPLVGLLPSIIALRDEIQQQQGYPAPVRVGAGGGIGTPISALGAFMMGAAYVVTGSINQGCVEAGTSAHTKKLLAEADMADVIMAPAADMFEMGVKLQVLKRGTFFPMRAQKLSNLYQEYDSIEAIPPAERAKLERQIFHQSLDEVWQECITFFQQRDPAQLERAADNPKRKMALIFRWYLGLASRWAITGEAERKMDYQIWCGPAMGAFNDWARGSILEDPDQRRVAEVARRMMEEAALLYRLHSLKIQGVDLPATQR